MAQPKHNDIPDVHPVTGEPIAVKVVKSNGAGAYTTRQTEIGEPDAGANVVEKLPSRNRPMSAQEIRAQKESDQPVPLTLEYVWKGTCPTCVNPVHTLQVNVAKKFVAIAYCSTCGINVAEKIVRRLNNEPKKAQAGQKDSQTDRGEKKSNSDKGRSKKT